jgi:hypothetical protein
MADSGYRAFHNGCGGMIAFGISGDGFCVECEDENVEFSDYTLVAVTPPEDWPIIGCTPPATDPPPEFFSCP